jgi:hypothetical protein
MDASAESGAGDRERLKGRSSRGRGRWLILALLATLQFLVSLLLRGLFTLLLLM